MNIRWEIRKFEELSNIELYRIMHLRLAIFSVEQNCPYQDADGKDPECFHLMGYDQDNELIVYSRIVPGGISYDEVSIGRVVSSAKVRGTGAGRALMTRSLEEIENLWGKVPVRISAQCYLTKFYNSFGFEIVGEEYEEDHIPHIEMLRPLH
jgi:ElaA protein